MKKTKKNFLIDIVAFISFVFLVSTGVVMYYNLPPGSKNNAIWGLSRHDWGDIHFWLAVVFLGILVLHLIMHWRWIVSLVKGKRKEGSGKRVLVGLIAFIALIAIAAAPVFSPVTAKKGHDTEARQNNPEFQVSTDVKGSMTLLEVQVRTGVPVKHIIKELKLPEDTDVYQSLSRLKDQYGFSIDDVKSIVKDFK